MSRIRKMERYDEFQCIADRCNFTCCSGWDIAVDSQTYDKWNTKERVDYFLRHVRLKKQGSKTCYTMKLEPGKRCPFLNEKGLCNIVTNYGEEYLSDTCQTFPRIRNTWEGTSELSLSCACPAVVDIINKKEEQLVFSCSEGFDHDYTSPGYRLRQAMITILQESSDPLKDRILIIFQMLLSIKDETSFVAELSNEVEMSIIEDNIKKYQDKDYQKALIGLYKEIEIQESDVCLENNELFLDIVQNYRKEKQYRYHLQDICGLAEDLNTDHNILLWERFKSLLENHDLFMENCLTLKLFTGCTSDNIDEMILDYQMVITEYVMTKYAAFLQWIKDGSGNEVAYQTLRDLIVCFTRIVSYNESAMKEFWEDSFDDSIWELGYIILLLY